MTKQLSKWYGAVADFNYAETEVNNVGGVSKLLMKGSIEQMAMTLLSIKKRLNNKRIDLRVLIQYTYGIFVYNEMIELRRKLRKQREDQVYRKREFRRNLLEAFLVILLISLIAGILVFFIALYAGKI